MNFLEDLPKPFFILAPMDDVTDTVFRQVIADCASPDFFFTEFVNVDGLQSPGRPRLLKKLLLTNKDRPLIAQLWGKNPDNFRKTAEQIADGSLAKEFGLADGINFAGVDLNMGCPQKNEVKAGTCSALINDRPLAESIIKATKEGLNDKLPLSVKTRLGWNEIDLTWPEFLLHQEINMLTMHGRTRKEMSKVPAHWDQIGEVRKIRDKVSPDTLIAGNGDVMSYKQGLSLAKEYGLDGIMIGRGIFHNPYVFSEKTIWQEISKEDRVDLYIKHVELFKETWQNNERPIHTLNKFCKIYINDFDNAKEIRENLMNSNSVDALLAMLHDLKRSFVLFGS